MLLLRNDLIPHEVGVPELARRVRELAARVCLRGDDLLEARVALEQSCH